MIELKGKYNTCKVFTDNIDSATISQLTALLNQQSVEGNQIRIMSDCHSGKGSIIGTTMTLTNRKVIPNIVGVDIGCLDNETQVLTEDGWIHIDKYNGQKILMYEVQSDISYFEYPEAYIIKDADMWYHFKNKYGLDQMVSPEHKMLIWKGSKQRGYKPTNYIAEELVEKHESLARGVAGGIKTTFNLLSEGIDESDIDIRINIMISADGHIREQYNKVEMNFKKDRKIERCKYLLGKANIEFKETICNDGSTLICFKNKGYTKDLHKYWKCNQHQLSIICDECMHWDGTIESDRKSFSTSIKENADLIQYAFACNGVRCGIQKYKGEKYSEDWNDWYNTYTTLNEVILLPDCRYGNYIERIEAKPGEKKYCFTTETGYFVIRRNNKISITGNCGVLAVKFKERRVDLPKLDSVIRKYVPSGGDVHEESKEDRTVLRVEELRCYGRQGAKIRGDLAYKSVGTLGGGNHYIELNKDSEDNIWLTIHTGSRHLGLEICDYYQNAGYEQIKVKLNNGSKKEKLNKLINELKEQGRHKEISGAIEKFNKAYNEQNPNIPFELAYVEEELFNDYIHDMKLVQEHAACNRAEIARIIMKHMKLHEVERFETIHNYIDTENMILRKGSVSAQVGEKLIIPINMRDGSLVCVGKGNPDWNYSAPHGMGRVMSRSQAKEQLSMKEFKKTMRDAGVYTTCISKDTIDESPMAYKNKDEVISNILDTVKIIDVIKPIYNFKAAGE